MGISSTKCEHCGIVVGRGGLHSIESCSTRIKTLLDHVHDEHGNRIDHFKLLNSLGCLEELKKSSSDGLDDIYHVETPAEALGL